MNSSGRRARLDDAELIALAKTGEPDAYDQLVRRYQHIAFRVAYLITGSASDAEECAQDGFVKAYFALARFRLGSPFRPWLLRIVTNEAKNKKVATARRFAFSLEAHPVELVSDVEESLEHTVLDQERADLLMSCLNELREDDRALLAYRYFLSLSEMEMATILGIAQGTVKSRLSRALARARTRLEARMGPS